MIPNISCLIQAAQNLNIKIETYPGSPNLVRVERDKSHFFLNCSAPLNKEDISKICLDKEFTYKVIRNTINTPETISFFDPKAREFKEFIKENNIMEMAQKAIEIFGEKVVVKMNSGKKTQNVYKCHSKNEIEKALGKIFDPRSKNYDFLALAQPMIDIKDEFRVVVYNQSIELVYKKWIFEKVEDLDLIQKLQEFINPIFKVLDLKYGGLDIALDKENKLWLIEINTAPRFEPFINKNGNKEIIELDEKILKGLD